MEVDSEIKVIGCFAMVAIIVECEKIFQGPFRFGFYDKDDKVGVQLIYEIKA